MSSEVAPKPLRADARRNRERVIHAAEKCFAECGVDAQMDDIATCAGVGVGTVYRHFPTKDALLQALAARRFGQLIELAHEALQQKNAWEAFRDYMYRSAKLQVEDRALSQEMPGVMKDAYEEAAELHSTVSELVRRGQEAGVIRPDVRPTDIPMIMCGFGRAAEAGAGASGGSWERYLAIILDGLRATGADPLPD